MAVGDKEARFTTLLHHVDADRLRVAYWAIRPQAAPGVDGVTWVAYGQELAAEPGRPAPSGSQWWLPGAPISAGVHPEGGRAATADQLGCPVCSGVLAPWGHGRARQIRGPGGLASWLQPRRSRCGDCRRTHVLLPMSVLVRRADCVEVIGAALGMMAAGAGHRKIGTVLDVAVGTVRGWLRRFASRVASWRAVFTDLVVSFAARVAIGFSIDLGALPSAARWTIASAPCAATPSATSSRIDAWVKSTLRPSRLFL